MKPSFFAAFLVVAMALSATSDSQASEPARVVGLEVGKATVAELEAVVRESGAQEKKRGTSSHTDGVLLSYEGDFGLPGLQSATFIFWPDGTLAAANLTLGKGRYGQIVPALVGKYELISEERPFVGNRSAVLRAGDVEIRASAPHMSFDMSLIYATDDFWLRLADNIRLEEETRRREQADRL